MNFIFWMLWVLDLMLVILVMQGSKFRAGFGASTDFNTWLLIALVIVLIVSVFLKYTSRIKWLSMIVVALPLICLLGMFLFERKARFE